MDIVNHEDKINKYPRKHRHLSSSKFRKNKTLLHSPLKKFKKITSVIEQLNRLICLIYRKSFHDVRLVRKSIMENSKSGRCESTALRIITISNEKWGMSNCDFFNDWFDLKSWFEIMYMRILRDYGRPDKKIWTCLRHI